MLLLDEVDLLSELNWPIGMKVAIDVTSFKIGSGLRWDSQWHLLDAVFYASSQRMSAAFKDSREAITILDSISKLIQLGISNKYIQQAPHLVLLNKVFYHREMKLLMAQWQLLYLRSKRLPTVRQTPSFLHGERPRKGSRGCVCTRR